ncbi:MAG: cytochrome c3 family protein [Coriobacteriales bacterium]|jgi:hypothetical protein|nr:cytochrome c3 family protein [Coriobacteriales bacterium]
MSDLEAFDTNETPEPNNAQKAEPGNGTKKKSHKKLFIVLGVIVAVIVAAGVGGLVWHNSPSFCGTLCHSPMATYVEGYESGDSNLLISTHKKAGNACLDCHEASIGEQIHEAQVWLAGDFTTPLAASGIGTKEFCLDCHDWDKVMEATDDYSGLYERGISTGFQGLTKGLNPHRSHMEDVDCGDCHSMHGTSVMQCNECHYLPLPEGWTDVWGGAGSPKLGEIPAIP